MTAKSFIRIGLVTAVAVLTLCRGTTFAQAALPDVGGQESYLSRPDILQIPARAMTPNAIWSRLKRGHFAFVAELLALYPEDTDIYFLARDGEYLYDIARLVTQGTSRAARIRLLNISRGNENDPHLTDYLAQEGISEARLRAGHKALLVDTGFAGNMIIAVENRFPEEVRAHIAGHLVYSETHFPESRAFAAAALSHFHPQMRFAFKELIKTYEFLPRYTDRSTSFQLFDGVYHPMSSTIAGNDGAVIKSKAVEFMQDLKADWDRPLVRKRFAKTTEIIGQLKSTVSHSDAEATRAILKSHATRDEKYFVEELARDTIRTSANSNYSTQLTYEDINLGLSTEPYNHLRETLRAHPEWEPYLSDPDTGVGKLVTDKNWKLLSRFIEMEIDDSVTKAITKALFAKSGPPEFARLRSELIRESSVRALKVVVVPHICYYSGLNNLEWKNEVHQLIERNSSVIWVELAAHYFRDNFDAKLDVVKQLISKKDQSTNDHLILNVPGIAEQNQIQHLIKVQLSRSTHALSCFDLFRG